MLQSRVTEIDSLSVQNYNDVHDRYNLVESDLTKMKNELRGEIRKNLTGNTERVVITRDLYNEMELELFSYENRSIHPMRFINQTREYHHFSNNNWEIQLTKIIRCFKGCLLYTSRCV